MARANLELNGLAADRYELVEGNVFEVLRGLRDRGRSFDLIVLDPPKFAAIASASAEAWIASTDAAPPARACAEKPPV